MTLATQTEAYWNASADSYVATAEPFTALFCEDAATLAAIGPGMTLLDVATGPGALALAAARRGARVTAIDFSQAMVDRLRARIGDLPITACRMDGQALDLPDASFDRACSVMGVPLFPDWRAGLGELARVLKPGGLAVIATADNPYGFGPNFLLAAARAALFADRPGVPPFESMVVLADRDRFAAALASLGLVDAVIHSRTHDFVFDAALFAPGSVMLDQNPTIADLNPADRARVFAAMAERSEPYRDGNQVRLPGTALIAVATRA